MVNRRLSMLSLVLASLALAANGVVSDEPIPSPNGPPVPAPAPKCLAGLVKCCGDDQEFVVVGVESSEETAEESLRRQAEEYCASLGGVCSVTPLSSEPNEMDCLIVADPPPGPTPPPIAVQRHAAAPLWKVRPTLRFCDGTPDYKCPGAGSGQTYCKARQVARQFAIKIRDIKFPGKKAWICYKVEQCPCCPCP